MHLPSPTDSGTSPEEAPPHHVAFVEQVQEGVSILAQAGCEDNHFELGPNVLHEVVHVRPLEHIHIHYLQAASNDVMLRFLQQKCCVTCGGVA